MQKYQSNSLSKYNTKKLTNPSFKTSLIKVHRLNSKLIKPITNNINKKTINQCKSNSRIFSPSTNIKKINSNISIRKKSFSKEKKNIFNKKQTLKNHNNSVIIKDQIKINTINTSKKNTKNSIKLDFKNQHKIDKKMRPNSPVCHLYYCSKNIQSENIDNNTIKNNHSCYFSNKNNNNNNMQYKSKKINSSGSTALSFSESCINAPISGKAEYSVDTVISSTSTPFEFSLMNDTLNSNINNKKNDKNISDNKVTLNKKNDISLLTFGNSYNDSAKKSYDSSTKKYIANLKKENESLKYQLNKKNEKINILQDKIETLLLNDTENGFLVELINNLKNMEKDFPELAIYEKNQLKNNIINNENKKQYINDTNNKQTIPKPNENFKVIRRMKSCSKSIQNEYKNKIK